MFCKHQWSVLSEHVSNTSFQDRAKLHGLSLKVNELQTASEVYGYTRVLTIQCRKCGRIKNYKECV